METTETRKMVNMAMFIAMVFVATSIYVQPPFGAGGLVHIGTLMMFAIALKYGKHYGAISAAIGMTMFDVLFGHGAWAPGTFVIRLAVGYVVGYLAESEEGQGLVMWRNIVAIAVGGFMIVSGYYVYEAIFLTTFYGALVNIFGNLLQIVIGCFGLFILDSLPKLETRT